MIFYLRGKGTTFQLRNQDFPYIYAIKLRIKSEIWKSWAKILIGRRFRQYPQKV